MSMFLETLSQSEHFRLRQNYQRMLTISALVAMTLHVLAFMFSSPYCPHPYQLREKIMKAVDFQDVFVIPAAPQAISRPELPQEAEISDEASIEETLAPTSYDPFAPPVIPDVTGSGMAETFVAYDTPPEVIHRVPAVYPELARQAQADGRVLLKVRVDEQGRVTHALVEDSFVIDSLERSAIAAVMQWLFKPAKQRDKPVAVWVYIPFNFALN